MLAKSLTWAHLKRLSLRRGRMTRRRASSAGAMRRREFLRIDGVAETPGSPLDPRRPVNFPRAGEKQAIRQRRAPPKKRARATPPPARADPPEATFSYEELIFERDAARAERDSLVIERDALRSERDTLRGQLSATTGFKDQLLAALLKQRPASSPPSVTASVAISNNTIEMSPTVSNNQTSGVRSGAAAGRNKNGGGAQ